MTVPNRHVVERLRQALHTGEFEIPRGMGFEGTGAPGLYLEHLLGLPTSNQDIPDEGSWEVKFSSGNSLITLFHKEANPRGSIREMIESWGWVGRNGRQSFRHTICGESDRFTVVDVGNAIRVVRTGHDDDFVPYWTHDVLVNSLARKLKNLILVHGSKRNRMVRYDSAEFLTEVRSTRFIREIIRGTVCIDFDAYIRESGAVRNHGTKFRIRTEDIRRLYTERQIF